MTALRALTITGERVMEAAGETARAMLDDYDDPIVRTYAATGLLMVAAAEIVSGLAKEAACDALREMLRDLGGLPS